jgi:hypothetical protein
MRIKKPSRMVAHDLDEQPFVHYYDMHPTKEDLMGESAAQSTLIHYLLSVLTHLFRARPCFIVSNLNIYRHRRRYEYPMAPDIAVFFATVQKIRSSLAEWHIGSLGSES